MFYVKKKTLKQGIFCLRFNVRNKVIAERSYIYFSVLACVIHAMLAIILHCIPAHSLD